MRPRLYAALLIAPLAGCGGSAPETGPAAAAPRTPTVVDPMLQQVERAKRQAAEMEQRKRQLDAELQAQER